MALTPSERQKKLRKGRKLSELIEVRILMPSKLHAKVKMAALSCGMGLSAYLLQMVTASKKS